MAERRTFVELDGVPHVRLPWMADGEPVAWTAAAPRLGEPTVAVLGEAGFTPDAIATMLRDGGAVAAEASR